MAFSSAPVHSQAWTLRHEHESRLGILSVFKELKFIAVWCGIPPNLYIFIRLFSHMVLLRHAGSFVICLFTRVIQHQCVCLMSDGNSAGPLSPRLSIHLHRHLGTLQDQLVLNRRTHNHDSSKQLWRYFLQLQYTDDACFRAGHRET